jgi:hypothetical protein
MGVLQFALPPGGLWLPASYRVLVGMATAIGATNWAAAVTAQGADL